MKLAYLFGIIHLCLNENQRGPGNALVVDVRCAVVQNYSILFGNIVFPIMTFSHVHHLLILRHHILICTNFTNVTKTCWYLQHKIITRLEDAKLIFASNHVRFQDYSKLRLEEQIIPTFKHYRVLTWFCGCKIFPTSFYVICRDVTFGETTTRKFNLAKP